MAQGRSVVCLTIDRLQAGFLGPYGNTWIHTPSFDQLAGRGFVFDQALAERVEFGEILDLLWTSSGASSLAELATQSGLQSLLVTDDAAAAEHRLAAGFQSVRLVEPALLSEPADDFEDTDLARFFAAAAEIVAERDSPSFIWLHTSALGQRWDAPLSLRKQYADEEDPEPPADAEVPSLVLAADHDPDFVLGQTHAYAGQVTLLDECLGGWLDAFDASPLAETALLVVLGLRGFPLGEHLVVGNARPELRAETIHVPLMLAFAKRQYALGRSQSLACHADVAEMLRRWVANADTEPGRGLLEIAAGQITACRNRVVLAAANERALRTPGWYVRLVTSAEEICELYAKPSDRWEVNEVADRASDIAARLRAMLDETADPAGPLADDLLAEPE